MENEQKTTEVDIEKMLTPDMAKVIDMQAYLFLREQGFDTDRCAQKDKKGTAARKRLGQDLKDKGLYLDWHLPTLENKIYCFFTLHRTKNKKEVAKSRTVEFVCQIMNIDGGDKDSE